MNFRRPGGGCEREDAARFEFAQAVVNTVWRWHVTVAHVKSKRVAVYFALKVRMLRDRFELRGKDEGGADVAVVKRLDAEAVAAQ